MIKIPPTNPARTYADALARVQALRDLDDETIHPVSHTKLWTHGSKTKRAVLYLQGYTDSTHQFTSLGEQLFKRGFNVFAPRLPYHGYQDRLSRDHAKLTPSQLVDWANQAVDTALGLGDSVTVIGLSLGGVMATWVAQYRGDVQQVLIISPAYGASSIPPGLTGGAARLFQILPNMFMWWDPKVKAETGVDYAYPRFATHTLARLFQFAGKLLQVARQKPPAAKAVWMITNANDFAVNNGLCDEMVAAWRSHSTGQIQTYQFPRELGLPHDLLDPSEVTANSDAVYTRLIEIIEKNLQPQANGQANG